MNSNDKCGRVFDAKLLAACVQPERAPEDEVPTFVKLHDMAIGSTAMNTPREAGVPRTLFLGMQSIYGRTEALLQIEIPQHGDNIQEIAKLLGYDVELYLVRKGCDATLGAHLIELATGASTPYLVKDGKGGEVIIEEVPEGQDWAITLTQPEGLPPLVQEDDVRKIATALTKRGQAEDVKKILAECSARTVSELEACQYPAVFDKLRDLWETVGTTVWPHPAFKGDLSPYATSGKLRDTLDKVTPEDAAAMAERWRGAYKDLNDFCLRCTAAEWSEWEAWRAGQMQGTDVAVIAGSDKATLTYLAPEGEDVTATHRRYPLTWDNTRQAFEAADLEADGQVVCTAVNVYAFNGALRDGSGKRAKRFMLFELAEVVPVSDLHVAVDKMNTHYFEHGTFERRAFNAENVRPATPSEVLEYLNAKYQYTLKTQNND